MHPHPHAPTGGAERGSQALEFAMVMPLIALLMTVVLAAGQAAVGVAATQHLAIAAARSAATSDDADVVAALARTGVVDLRIDPPSPSRQPGTVVTVTLTRRVDVLWVPDPGLATTATASHLTEDVP